MPFSAWIYYEHVKHFSLTFSNIDHMLNSVAFMHSLPLTLEFVVQIRERMKELRPKCTRNVNTTTTPTILRVSKLSNDLCTHSTCTTFSIHVCTHFTELVSSWLKFFRKTKLCKSRDQSSREGESLCFDNVKVLYLHFVLSNSNYESFGSVHRSAWGFHSRSIWLCQTQWHYRICVNDAPK